MSASPTVAAADPLAPPPAELVPSDLFCVRCDYNLKMQPIGGACPECGEAVAISWCFPRLQRGGMRWLISLRDSAAVMLVAWVMAALLTVVGLREFHVAIAMTAPWALTCFGVWLLTRPEPGRGWSDEPTAAWALRLCAAGSCLAFFIDERVFLAALCSAAATLMYFLRLAEAARRLPSPRLMRLARAPPRSPARSSSCSPLRLRRAARCARFVGSAIAA
jgi:hypothetical protein